MTKFSGLRASFFAAVALALLSPQAQGQIDPEKRRLIQFGYNQALEGEAPIAGYGFFYYNKPNFTSEDRTLRLAIAPVYIDAELGFSRLLGPNTDFGIGVGGGAFAATYSEIRNGKYLEGESFNGHGGEVSASIYHRINPESQIPLSLIVRATLERTLYERDETDPGFDLPPDHNTYHGRVGLRYGGREPSLTAPLAMELSAWYEYQFRDRSDLYGFNNDRELKQDAHTLWARALLRYTFPSEQLFDLSLTMGITADADRVSAYRLGGVLPFASEFPLSIPGYYYQEISAKRFALLNGQYSIPLTPNKEWLVDLYGAAGIVEYLDGLDQPGGEFHSGVGAGFTYASPRRSWFVTLVYGHGFRSIRTHGRGSNTLGVLFQYDFEARKHGRQRPFEPKVSPYRSRGGERLFR